MKIILHLESVVLDVPDELKDVLEGFEETDAALNLELQDGIYEALGNLLNQHLVSGKTPIAIENWELEDNE